MIIDTSAIYAILLQESDADRFARAIQADPVRWISAATLVEAGVVALRLDGARGAMELDRFMTDSGIEVLPVTAEHARIARDGFLRFGKGRHPAALNYGDCFSHALAIASQQPLLFKGDDFSRTDVQPVALPLD